MDGANLLRIVDAMHKERNISREVIFQGIEAAVQLAAQKATHADEEITVSIDRHSGELKVRKGDKGLNIDPSELGRIAAYTAKQMVIQKIREAESDNIYDEYHRRLGEMIRGTITRVEAGTAIVSLGKSEALLPRSEQIPGESHHPNQQVKAIIHEVKKNGHRVKIVLSRTHPDFVRCLFEDAIPEIMDRTIEIKSVSREAGYRSKVAVSSIDSKVDCVGACVGVRGSRIKSIIEELNGERIDIVRWNDSLQVLIPNALQPAQISELMLYPRLGRAIVLVTEDQLSLAIGRRGQNVRLASKLVGWDIEIMTHEELSESLDKAERWFRRIPHFTPEILERLIEEGFLSYNDLTFVEPMVLGEIVGLSEEDADDIIAHAEEFAEQMEQSGGGPIEDEEEQVAEEAAAATIVEAVDAVAADAAEPTDKETLAMASPDDTAGEADGEEPPPSLEALLGEVSPEPTADAVAIAQATSGAAGEPTNPAIVEGPN